MPISVRPEMLRPQCHYGPQNSRFLVECDFTKQYHHYYRKRLEKTRPRLEVTCRQKWDPTLPIYSLAEVANPKPAMCIVIGTIFKQMKLQPDVIEELSTGNFDINSESYPGHYTSQDDKLILEDSEESIQLVGKIDPKNLVTGITVALMGIPMDNGGRFLVHDICFAQPSHRIRQEPTTPGLSFNSEDSGPVYLMVLSSLGFHCEMSKDTRLTKALQNMIDFVWGGEKFSADQRSWRISRILIVGDSFHDDRFPLSKDEKATELDKDDTKSKQQRPEKTSATAVQVTNLMDDFFAQLSKTVNVDLMPGPSDPSSHLMPQQPFHPCMFPKSSMFPSFNCTTNPHDAIYGDAEVLATSGQNVDIISKFSDLNDPIEIMRCHLQWGNSAPSAPDNLFSIPYEDEDPFIIQHTPDVYIAGCQQSYKVEYYDCKTGQRSDVKVKGGTMMLSVPEFYKTLSCVLVDLKSLEPQLVSFE